jgi:hypothetical protein
MYENKKIHEQQFHGPAAKTNNPLSKNLCFLNCLQRILVCSYGRLCNAIAIFLAV